MPLYQDNTAYKINAEQFREISSTNFTISTPAKIEEILQMTFFKCISVKYNVRIDILIS